MKYPLYLASGSAGRKELLSAAEIPFTLINHDADETTVSLDRPLPEVVTEIAQLKMKHALLPNGKIDGSIVFVLTADTLTLKGSPESFEIFGKPKDRDHARYMLQTARQGSITGTGFCIAKKIWKENKWHDLDVQTGYAEGEIIINIPDDWIDFYLDRIDFLNVSGAIKIRGLCEQFTQEVQGSYSAIIGLPMYEVRSTLETMGFYS
ncbi:Maf family protein [Candidatus Babeliales bacterium]|nr:Maf family protein [Candidatus Babeliales bacterium]